jgi:hypothetical protein
MDNNESFQVIMSKLDRVIQAQAETNSRLGMLEEEVGELRRTIRGYNGTPGMVTELAVLQESLKNFQAGKNLSGGSDLSPVVDKAVAEVKAERKNFLTYEYVLDKAMNIGMAFLVWILLTVLPDIISHLQKP